MVIATDAVRLLSEPLVRALPNLAWLIWPVAMLVAASVVMLAFITPYAMLAVWMERKVSGRIQGRLGPTEVGPFGLFQTLADGIKLLAKEDLIPRNADVPLFIMGPIVAFAGVFLAFVVIPFGPDLIVNDLNLGLVYIAAVGSVEAFGVILAGWASNNKWSLFGAMRAATQVVSYEIPLGISFLAAILVAGSFSLQDIITAQAGGIHAWLVFRNPAMPLLFIVLFIANLAECKRAPFDLPEAESELVSGFHTEYSAMRFSIFFLAEYAAMYVVSAVFVAIFLGGWLSGIPPVDDFIMNGGILANLLGLVIIVTKSVVVGIFVQMWLRWTLPRIRLDQVMHICLKVLLPISMFLLVVVATWESVLGDRVFFGLIEQVVN